jgi:hypothetical protein
MEIEVLKNRFGPEGDIIRAEWLIEDGVVQLRDVNS